VGRTANPDPSGQTGGRNAPLRAREIVNGLMYVLSTGCQWRLCSQRPAAEEPLFGYFDLELGRTLDRIHHALYVKCREDMIVKRANACVIDSQSVESAEKGGAASIRAL